MTWLLSNPDGVALLLALLLCLAAAGMGLRPRKATGGDEETLDSWPHLVRAEFLVGVACLALVTLWALLLDPPLGQPANPSFTPAVTRAPWFLVGVQELLQFFAPWVGAFLIPLLLVTGLCLVPYLDPDGWSEDEQVKSRAVPALVLALLSLLVAIPAVVGLFFRGPHWRFMPAWRQPPVAQALPAASLSSPSDWIILLPLLLLPPFWLRLRQRSWARRMGPGRFMVAGTLLALLLGALIKVALVVAA